MNLDNPMNPPTNNPLNNSLSAHDNAGIPITTQPLPNMTLENEKFVEGLRINQAMYGG